MHFLKIMYFCLLLGTVFVAASASESCRPPVGKSKIPPGILDFKGWPLTGYNLLEGVPMHFRTRIDPGFGQSIFEACYKEDIMTSDGRYLVPDGTSVTLCNKSCSFSFKTNKISGLNSYRNLLQSKASVVDDDFSYEWANASFGASPFRSFQFVQDQLSSSFVFTYSEASCCAYKIQMDEANLPPFTKSFLDGVKLLPEVYDEWRYMWFIGIFGTHYIDQMDLGSLFAEFTMMSRANVEKMLEDGLDISASASLHAKKRVKSQFVDPQVPGFTERLSSKWAWFQSTVPPTDYNETKWMEETMVSSFQPLRMRIKSLENLLYRDGLLDASKAGKIRENMRKALKSYCSYLRKIKDIGSCSGAQPDTPFPDTFHQPTTPFPDTFHPSTTPNSSSRLWGSVIGSLFSLMILLFI